MKIQIRVKTSSRIEAVEKQADGSYRVAVNAPPVEGRANEAVIEVLARHFGVPKSSLRIVSGHKGKNKVVEIP